MGGVRPLAAAILLSAPLVVNGGEAAALGHPLSVSDKGEPLSGLEAFDDEKRLGIGRVWLQLEGNIIACGAFSLERFKPRSGSPGVTLQRVFFATPNAPTTACGPFGVGWDD